MCFEIILYLLCVCQKIPIIVYVFHSGPADWTNSEFFLRFIGPLTNLISTTPIIKLYILWSVQVQQFFQL